MASEFLNEEVTLTRISRLDSTVAATFYFLRATIQQIFMSMGREKGGRYGRSDSTRCSIPGSQRCRRAMATGRVKAGAHGNRGAQRARGRTLSAHLGRPP